VQGGSIGDHSDPLGTLVGVVFPSPKAIRSIFKTLSNTQHPTPSTQAEAAAETCFLKAIDIAQKQQAKSLELRAVMSLARLWQQQGRKQEAQQRLAEIYGWFTEGFDTKDLQEAKALLTELTG
jgi:murein L,D-transpeptidase YcbB/YkuD